MAPEAFQCRPGNPPQAFDVALTGHDTRAARIQSCRKACCLPPPAPGITQWWGSVGEMAENLNLRHHTRLLPELQVEPTCFTAKALPKREIDVPFGSVCVRRSQVMFEGSPWRDNTLDSQSPNIQRCLCSYKELRSPQLVYSSLLSRNEDDSGA